MRIKPGASSEETVKAMTPVQRRLLGTVERARAREQSVVKDSVDRTREAVREALSEGVPARIMASRLDVSLARIYQMRDEAEVALRYS